MNILDPLTMPLTGQQLIEASAGTGKTYTISSLVLRLLLGDACTALGIEQVLIVTFTNAATAELRARVRERIQQAHRDFCRDGSEDAFIEALIRRHADPESARLALALALQNIDEAPIYTIHGFCQRVLQQNAFDSGVMFENEFLLDEQQLRLAASADFWRRNFYDIDHILAAEILRYWQGPEELLREISPWLGVANIRFISNHDSEHERDFRAVHEDNLQRIKDFKSAWRACDDDLFELIQASGINRNKYKRNNLASWLAQVDEFVNTGTSDYQIPECLKRFAQSTLQAATQKGEPPGHPLFVTVEEFLAKPLHLKDCLLQHAIREIGALLAAAKQRQAIVSPDDLLRDLAKALGGGNQSAAILAKRIRQQYPVAMIDEFQDTDELQYQIYRQVYATGDVEEEHALLMIGDPKQAIYAFRGADIFSYITARRETASDNIFTLATNYRSTKAVVEATNKLFSGAQAPFIYSDDIRFTAVESAAGANEKPFLVDGDRSGIGIYCLQGPDKETIGRDNYLDYFAGYFAADIFCLLQRAQQGEALIDGRALQSNDIAVLVRNRHEAQRFKNALASHGIGSVFISEESVFDSREAQCVYSFLQACQNPRDERLIKTTLADTIFALDACELDALNEDALLWNSLQQEFEHYHQTWHDSGVMAVFLELFAHRDVAYRILRTDYGSDASGERVLTNILHLVEILQVQSALYPGPNELLQWFAMQFFELQRQRNTDAQQLRLESDQNLVQIVTIHKSKGLEYNIVYLPFAVSYRRSKTATFHDSTDRTLVVDLTESEANLQQAEQERLAEDLRLLYVALTRAVYRCELGVCDLRGAKGKASVLDKTALGYLLLNRGDNTGELSASDRSDLAAILQNLQQQGHDSGVGLDVTFCDPQEAPAQGVLKPTSAKHQDLQCRSFSADIEKDWWITSYSALSRYTQLRSDIARPLEPPVKMTMAAISNDHRYDDLGSPLFEFNQAVQDDAGLVEQQATIFSFPRGANAGTFMHTVFELLDMHKWREQLPELVTAQLQRFGFSTLWQATVETMVENVLQCYLDEGNGLRLADIPAAQRLTEMEFFLPLSRLQAGHLQTCLKSHGYLADRTLQFDAVQGMLKGFIDLVFCHQGRYFVLDYKSNYLGNTIEHYSQAAMQTAVSEHVYDLQYLLYSVALQRYLQQRIPQYEYQRHFGGVYYLFLRGMNTVNENHCGVFYDRPAESLLSELDQLLTVAMPGANA